MWYNILSRPIPLPPSPRGKGEEFGALRAPNPALFWVGVRTLTRSKQTFGYYRILYSVHCN